MFPAGVHLQLPTRPITYTVGARTVMAGLAARAAKRALMDGCVRFSWRCSFVGTLARRWTGGRTVHRPRALSRYARVMVWLLDAIRRTFALCSDAVRLRDACGVPTRFLPPRAHYPGDTRAGWLPIAPPPPRIRAGTGWTGTSSSLPTLILPAPLTVSQPRYSAHVSPHLPQTANSVLQIQPPAILSSTTCWLSFSCPIHVISWRAPLLACLALTCACNKH